MQVWTPEKLKSAAQLYRLGMEPKAISAEIGVSLSRVVWLIGYRKDLFEAKAKAQPARRERAPDPVAAGRSLVALLYEPPRRAAFEPGIDSFQTEPPAPTGQPVSLLQATSRHCKWPLSMDGSASKLFCGDAAISGESWCPHHAARVREKGADTRGAAR